MPSFIKPGTPWLRLRNAEWEKRLESRSTENNEVLLYYDGPCVETWSLASDEFLWVMLDRGPRGEYGWLIPMNPITLSAIVREGDYVAGAVAEQEALLVFTPYTETAIRAYTVPAASVNRHQPKADGFDRRTSEWAASRLRRIRALEDGLVSTI